MKKLVAYITAALPDREFTIDLALALGASGVDSLELGVPFSDPVADGPIIEHANLLALQKGFSLQDLYEITKKISPSIDTLWMGYLNPFHKVGFEQICQKAKSLGVSGLIIPDVPFEESAPFEEQCLQNDLALIRFIAPTLGTSRIATIAPMARKFIYLVAYAGITGSGREEPLSPLIEEIRAINPEIPLYLGFGVNEHNAKEKSKEVDGVIVGSALVKVLLDERLTNTQKMTTICALAKSIKESINS